MLRLACRSTLHFLPSFDELRRRQAPAPMELKMLLWWRGLPSPSVLPLAAGCSGQVMTTVADGGRREHQRLLDAASASPWGGHCSIPSAHQPVRTVFWWPKLSLNSEGGNRMCRAQPWTALLSHQSPCSRLCCIKRGRGSFLDGHICHFFPVFKG